MLGYTKGSQSCLNFICLKIREKKQKGQIKNLPAENLNQLLTYKTLAGIICFGVSGPL